MKSALIIFGMISLLLGIIGIFLPLLPTTPFLLLAAACFSKGSDWFYRKLIENKWLGEYIKNYREGRGIPKRTKMIAILLLWVTILYSAIIMIDIQWVKILLVFIAIAVTIHILTMKTLQNK